MDQLENISDTELSVFVKTFIEQGLVDIDEMMSELQLIDRQLTVLRSKALLTRKSPSTKAQLEALIRCHHSGERALWNSRSKKYSFVKS